MNPNFPDGLLDVAPQNTYTLKLVRFGKYPQILFTAPLIASMDRRTITSTVGRFY